MGLCGYDDEDEDGRCGHWHREVMESPDDYWSLESMAERGWPAAVVLLAVIELHSERKHCDVKTVAGRGKLDEDVTSRLLNTLMVENELVVCESGCFRPSPKAPALNRQQPVQIAAAVKTQGVGR